MSILQDAAKLLGALLDRKHNQLIKLTFPKGDGPGVPMVANRLDAHEGLSRDFHFAVEVMSSDPQVELKSVLGKMVTVELTREKGAPRFFNGYVFEFRFVRIMGGLAVYDMVLLPWLAFLRLRKDNHLFHGATVEDQTKQIFGDYTTADWEMRALGDDPAMTDACQFDESDYNYVHRRWEALGWHYHYEHSASGHKLVLSGDSTLSDPIPGDPTIPLHDQALLAEDNGFVQFTPVRKLSSNAVATASFDFKRPRPVVTETTSLNAQGDIPPLEVYEYTGAYGFSSRAEGESFARLRMEEIDAAGKHFQAIGNHRGVLPGRWFTLGGRFDLVQGGAAGDGEFLLVDVTHTADNHYEDGPAAAAEYHNRLSCLRKKIPWRPSRGMNSSDPKIYGLQTAIIVGPEGAEIHSDEYGRVKVQFHWDRIGTFDDKSSAWVRVASTWAGSNFGFIAIPRIGQEVLVQFLDGNPDRPLITGRVYNAANMPPWELPANQTQTGILTRSSKGGGYENANAIRFEDKKGSEEVWLHAEKNQRIEVENDESHWVGHDRDKVIDRDETSLIKRDRTETVDRNETIVVHNNRSERVDHHETISIGGNRKESVSLNETITIGLTKTETIGIANALTIGAGYAVTVGGAMNTAVGLSQTEQVGLAKRIDVGKTIDITAGDSLRIQVGESSILMKSDGRIEIVGNEIFISGKKKVEIHGDDVDINPGPASAAGPEGAAPEVTGLGSDVDDIAAKSPTLQKDLSELKKQGWTIVEGAAGGGSHANRATKTITMDPNLKKNPKEAVQVLAHEAGHAKHPFVDDRSGKAAYLNATLGDEGAATMNNIKVQREITANGGPDIGIAGNAANHPKYNAAYDQYVKDGNAGAAQKSIGQIFGNGERVSGPTNPTYNDYYGGWYEKNYPGKP